MVVDSDGGGNNEYADLSDDASRLADAEARRLVTTSEERSLVLRRAYRLTKRAEETDRDYEERVFNSLDLDPSVHLKLTLRKVRKILAHDRARRVS